MWKKFQKFPPCTLEDIGVRSGKNPFLGPAKTWVGVIQRLTFV